ncbi:MAG TPA: hypothetical protein VH702_17625 [Vicinamibacterales bacterium]|jgi:hypothetical protein
MPDFRVFLLKECLINPPPPVPAAVRGLEAALLGLFVPKLIEMTIGGIAGALRKAGEEETEQLTADQFSDLYLANAQQALSVNPELGCVLGVWFDNVDKSSASDDDVAATLKSAGLVPAKAVVGGVFEAAVRPAADGTAFFLDTRHFSVRKFIGDRRKDNRAYVMTLSLTTPDATAEGSTFAVGQINLGTRVRGESVVPAGHPTDGFPRYRSNLMPWSKISAASKAAYERDVAAARAKGRRYMPVTFSLTVSETADGNKLLLKLGELLGGLAGKAAGEIGRRILPAEIDKSAAEEAAYAESLYEQELKAELEVRKAQKTYDAADEADKPALRVALEIARRKLAWQTSLREAAGLNPRPPVDPR